MGLVFCDVIEDCQIEFIIGLVKCLGCCAYLYLLSLVAVDYSLLIGSYVEVNVLAELEQGK